MKNKNLIIGGVILAGLVAYYFYNKRKGSGLASMPSSSPIETKTTNVNSNVPIPTFKGGSPAVGTSSVFDCEKAKVENKQIYEGV